MMSASTARSSSPPAGVTEESPFPAIRYDSEPPLDACVELWLSHISERPNGDDSCSSCSSSSDDGCIMAVGDMMVDELGNVARTRRELASLRCGDRQNLSSDDFEAINETDEDLSSSGADLDEAVVLQSVLFESVASALHEEQQRSMEMEAQIIPDISDILTTPWADIEMDDGDESETEISPADHNTSKPTKTNDAESFNCSFTAWYDPPKGRGGRQGIASHAYEQSLFEMGLIQCASDFWTVHEMVDWENMPSNSMLSFSREGSKPFWEDPMHCNGGRWIIRGFPRHKSESLFTKVVLSLFLGHFPESSEFTCVTLQVKEKRRGNSIQLWTQSLDYLHIEEIEEHIAYLVDDWESDNDATKRRRKGKKSARVAPTKRLNFEFCPNSESIERNAVKLGDLPTACEVRSRRIRNVAETSMASRCLTVSEMYTAGHSRKKNSKLAEKPAPKKGRVKDWSDTLSQMGYGRPGRAFDKAIAQISTDTPTMSRASSVVGDMTPQKRSASASKNEDWENTWRSQVKSNNPKTNKKWWGTEKKEVVEDNWRQRRHNGFLGIADDVEEDELTFVEYDPKLVGQESPWANYQGDMNGTDWTWGHSTTTGGWAPLYANSQFMSIEPSTGVFDSHGCWYPPAAEAPKESQLPPVPSTATISTRATASVSQGSLGNSTEESVPSDSKPSETEEGWAQQQQQYWAPEHAQYAGYEYYPSCYPYTYPATQAEADPISFHSSEISRLADSVAEHQTV